MKIYKEWLVAFALVVLMASQKLVGAIDWSWWIVTSPIFGLVATYVLVFLIVFAWFKLSKLFKK